MINYLETNERKIIIGIKACAQDFSINIKYFGLVLIKSTENSITSNLND